MTYYMPEEWDVGPHKATLCQFQLQIRLPYASPYHLQPVQRRIKPITINDNIIYVDQADLPIEVFKDELH